MNSSNSCSNVSVPTSDLHEAGEQLTSPARGGWLRRLWGSVVLFAGFMLSPLSWWNDLFVNVPLALGFAWLISLCYPPAFKTAVVVGYALTNVLGFVLMHLGGEAIVGKPAQRHLRRDIGLALLYTAVVFALVQLGALQFAWAGLVQK